MRQAARNLEIKVQCGEAGLADVRARLEGLGGDAASRLRQVDTYFRVPMGRLKLREIRNLDLDRDDPEGARSELIAYLRPDEAASRWSTYRVTRIATAEVATLLASLEETMGTLVRVAKRREIVVLDATRIHLDTVEHLGSYIELETVIGGQSDADASAEHARIAGELGLDRWAPISGSYSDLLLAKGGSEARGSLG